MLGTKWQDQYECAVNRHQQETKHERSPMGARKCPEQLPLPEASHRIALLLWFLVRPTLNLTFVASTIDNAPASPGPLRTATRQAKHDYRPSHATHASCFNTLSQAGSPSLQTDVLHRYLVFCTRL